MKKLYSTIASILFFFTVSANNYVYWIQFNTKSGTPYSIEQAEVFLSERAIERRLRHGIAVDSTDLPVNPVFLDSLSSLGFEIKHTSKWMNGAIAYFPADTPIDSVFMPSFVDGYQLRKGMPPLKSTSNKFFDFETENDDYYGDAYDQISMLNGHELHKYSRGDKVHIAILDAGFSNTNIITAFDSIRSRSGILGTYDFVNPGNSVYDEHDHGTAVFSTMAGLLPKTLVGTAPDASYWLLRTEDSRSEFPVEEDYWVVAVEFADSVGCEVINTSLGYTTFDDTTFNHTYDLFDGNTLRISKAANMAVEKGIVIVCSAGNSGNDPWRYISAPSEAEAAISVAAVASNRQVVNFSSRGFSHEGALSKPDVAAMGAGVTVAANNGSIVRANGTSFSSPIVAGMAACLVGLYPEKNAYEISDLIRSIGDQYPEHSVEYGFGIPDFGIITDTIPVSTSESFFNCYSSDNEFSIYPNPFNSNIKIRNCQPNTVFSIYSIHGNQVFSKKLLKTNAEISGAGLSNLPKGVYFAVLKGKKASKPVKLIKH
jgi:subtilisin family serine protease